MNHIGNIIKIFRNKSKMTRAKLASNICTEKYIYLIERGERVPSTEMIRMLSNKLGVDLFEFYKYRDCIDPIIVYETIKKFNIYRRLGNFTALKEVTNTSMYLTDFQKKPWICEIETNEIIYLIYEQHKYNDAIEEINKLIIAHDQEDYHDSCISNLFILLSNCYEMIGDLKNAKNVALTANELIHNKKIPNDHRVVINVNITLLKLDYFSGEYNGVINKGNKLIQHLSDTNNNERSFYAYFFMAFAYYKIGKYSDSIKWFKKGIYLLLVYHKPNELYYLMLQDLFLVLLDGGAINAELVREFKKMYKIK